MMKDWEAQVAQEWVRWGQKEEVLKKQREEKRREAQVLLKIQSMAVAKAHLKGLVPNAVQSLQEEAFPDMTDMAITRDFIPKIVEEVRQQVHSKAGAEKVITKMVRTNVKARTTAQTAARQVLVDRWNALEATRLEEAKTKRGNIRIYVPDAEGTPVAVGPIQIDSQDNIEDVQKLVFEWLQANQPRLLELFPHGVIMAMQDENGTLVPVASTADMFEAKAGQISMLPQEPPADSPRGDGADGEGDGEGGDPLAATAP